MASHEDVAKAWWNRTGDKNGNNMFCEGNTIYSYGRHFPIAKLMGSVVLFNPEKYSVSTQKHQGIVHRQITGQIIKMIDCDESKAVETFKDNIHAIEHLTGKMKRARTRKEYYQEEIEELIEQNELIKNRYLKQKIVEDL